MGPRSAPRSRRSPGSTTRSPRRSGRSKTTARSRPRSQRTLGVVPIRHRAHRPKRERRDRRDPERPLRRRIWQRSINGSLRSSTSSKAPATRWANSSSRSWRSTRSPRSLPQRHQSDKLIGALDGTSRLARARHDARDVACSDVTDIMNRDPLSDATDALASSKAARSMTSFVALGEGAARTTRRGRREHERHSTRSPRRHKSYYAAQVQLLAQIEQVRARSASDVRRHDPLAHAHRRSTTAGNITSIKPTPIACAINCSTRARPATHSRDRRRDQ
jgi:hypothetical protein